MREEYRIMVIAWLAVAVWVAFVIFTNRRQHPKALFFLFMVELWERFSYYGMRALLILYLTKTAMDGGFGFEKKIGYGIYGAYGALVYLTPLLGGFLADKYLGFRKSIIWGAILMAAGQFTLFFSWDISGDGTKNTKVLMYLGLSLLVLGNGFFKPNISSLIGKFYAQGDPRRDGAFTIFYMGINIGAFLTPLTCGTVGEIEGWGYGFLLAGIGMIAGLCIFLVTQKLGLLEDKADPPKYSVGGEEPKAKSRMDMPILLGSLLFLPLICMLIYQNDVMDYLLAVVGLVMIGYIIFLSFQYPVVERQRLWVITILLVFTAIFWTFFELAGSALNIFTDNNVDKNLFGLTLKTSNFQAVNALFIMMFAPVFSFMWTYLAKNKLEPAAPIKFAIALLLLGAGFMVLNLGVPMAQDALIPAMFLITLYLLHTLGELALSPVGLSLVTKLSPAKIVAFMMGFWFLSSSIAHQAGKLISNLTAVDENATKEQSLELAMKVFNQVGFVAIGSGVLLIFLSPMIKRWMHGVR
ncbi:MAG: MFS transporter [Gemmataceae bacterium]|nr:MFS transporter [Gemmataceae bacterium]